MAESSQNRKHVFTCPICVETFRKPVIWPCQHSFCRECIGLYADKSKPVQKEEVSGSTENKDAHQVIPCPVCRAPTSLGTEGVAGLPTNFHLAEIVDTFSTAVKVEDDLPRCSLCEEDNPAKAVKFCSNCSLLYCKDCLAALHPVRGAMKSHRLISVQEYLTQETSQRQVSREEHSDQQPSCARHGQPLGLYCEPCRMAICMGCVVGHQGHGMRDIPSAAGREKPAIIKKASELEKVLRETKESLSEVLRLRSMIQENQELHKQEVEKVYSVALGALQAWRQRSLDDIKTRYSQWNVECSGLLKHVQLQAQEMERMVQASKDLLALSMDVEFLQGSTDFNKTIDGQLNEIRADLEKHELCTQKLLDSVERDLVVPREVTVKETGQEPQGLEAAVGGQTSPLPVIKPTLRFTETSDRELRITEGGSGVEAEDLSLGWWGAVTDGRYQTGRYYWELQITCSPDCDCYCVCDVGVIQESRGVGEDPNPGHDAWYIVMRYCGDEVRCCSDCGGEVSPEYGQRRPYRRPHHLGLYLDCDQHTLTVVDRGSNQVMVTVRGVVVTEPLRPWLRFYGPVSVSARLVPGDSVTLPQVIWDRPNTS